MQLRLVNRGRQRYPHTIEVVDLAAELSKAGLPPIQQVNYGDRENPEIPVWFEREFRDGEELVVPSGEVQLLRRSHEGTHPTLNELLVFEGLAKVLSKFHIRRAPRARAVGLPSEIALTVKFAELTVAESDLFGLDNDDADDEYQPLPTERRQLILRQIRERRGQRRFRNALRNRNRSPD